MEITNDIKSKVFAQYFGQRLTGNSTVSGLFLDMPVKSDKFKLILKPLSSIIDEDFMELAIVCGYVIGKVNRNDHYIWGDYINNGGVHTGTFRIDTEKTSYKGKITTDSSNGNPRHDIYTCHALNGFQFLQNKGYDLPNYLLSGKTLFEAGLAIYE
jgi:hypothetical protein